MPLAKKRGKRPASNAPAFVQSGRVSLSVTASVAPTAVTTETIFSQVVVTAARAGLVTDRKTRRMRGESLFENMCVPFRVVWLSLRPNS
jgi:hypothetical protein